MAGDHLQPTARDLGPPRENDHRPFQFSLRKLMLLVAVVALACGIAVSLWRAIDAAREAARTAQCMCPLGMIQLAFHNYSCTRGSLMPATINDSNGKPMHSWRVLCLPYMEEDTAYKRYDFSKPWNSPTNKPVEALLWSRTAKPFQCPSAGSEGTMFTNYVAVTGPGTLWDPDVGANLSEKYADKILVVEILDSDIHWMEPRDITVEEAMRMARGVPGRTMSSRHPRGINCIMGDGSCRTIPRDIDAKTLREMFRVAPDR